MKRILSAFTRLSQPGHSFLSVRLFHFRRHVVTFWVFMAFAAALAKLAYFAADDAASILAKLRGQSVDAPVPTLTLNDNDRARAPIVDANGVMLASTVNIKVLCQSSKGVSNPVATARTLAQVIPAADEAELRSRLEAGHRWLKYEVSPRQQQQIHDLYLRDIEFCDDKRRDYPQGALFAHLIGFTDTSNEGLSGMERRLNLELKTRQSPVRTSLDVNVQSIVTQELAAQIERFEALGGVAIVMRANTSEIVSMVSLPTYDPNTARNASHPSMFNRATKGVYELGSIMKPFTVAAALNEELVSPNALIDVTRNLQIDTHTIADFTGTPKGMFTVPQVIERSSNIGTARIADLLGAEKQQQYLRRFGFTQPADLEIAEVAAPLVPHTWGRIQTMTVSYGHGISITPLQAVAAEAALVNGGLYRRPTLLARGGQDVETRRVISPQTSAQIRGMLRRVAVFGSGKNANAEGYVVGGKTGTADKPQGGAYNEEDARIASFMGAFPIHDPEYVILVSIDEPKPQEWTYGYATGGWVAAPVFKTIVEKIAPHLGVQRVDEDPYGLETPTSVQPAAPTAAPTIAAAPVTSGPEPTPAAAPASPAPSPAPASSSSAFIDAVIDGTIF